MIKDIKRMKNERGFTLIELLVVIVILGILAAVVVFAVGGLNDKGEESACKIDTRTIRTAQEAYFANQGSPGGYASEATLVEAGLLSEESNLHDIRVPGTTDYNGAAAGGVRGYDILVDAGGAPDCGAENDVVGFTAGAK